MTKHRKPPIYLTRRSWMLLTASSLAGCGGGGSSVAGLPGTGGTGIYTQGSISGFGSVIINGVKYDDLAATVKLNGVAATSAELRLGMVAIVQGEIGAVTTQGTARSIDAWSIAQGQITQVTAGEFVVAGMKVRTDSATMFEGVASVSRLSAGQRVVVWGLQASADARTWAASRVGVVTTVVVPVVSTGLVQLQGSQFYVNGLLLTGPLTAGLVAGRLVRVQGTPPPTGASLVVDRVDVPGLNSAAYPTGDIEIEGVVTTPLANGRFTLGNVVVDVSRAFYKPADFVPVVGARVEVYGSWQPDGILKATEVENEDEQKLSQVEIDARIEQFTSLADFVVRGQRCDATRATISRGLASDLAVGVKVKVKGTKVGGNVLLVAELEFDH